MADEPPQEGEVRRQSVDLGLLERLGKPIERLRARLTVRDQLRDHRVVRRADGVTLFDSRVYSDAPGQAQSLDSAALREEGRGILRVEPHLDRMSAQLGAIDVQRLALRDSNLLVDEVDARHELGHRVLHLDPAVQLEEVEIIAVEHEFSRPGAPVADRAREREGGFAHA